MNRSFERKSFTLRGSACLLLMLFVCLSCGFRKPWRSYEQQAFDSQKWKAGDGITRGTMIVDLHGKRMLNGQSRETVVGLLGEPDKKRAGNSNTSSEVWLYGIEVVGEKTYRYYPVSFDKQGRASSGEVSGGTISLAVDE
jgi:hypothetical protein